MKTERRKYMKAIFSLRRHHYLKAASVFLIAALIIVGVVSCEPGETYDLTMAVNPGGAGTATDETGGSPYTALTSVDISATAAPCYRFVSWTAPAGIFGNATAADTTFIMPASAVTVTANFEAVPPDHFKLYFAEWEAGPPATLPVDVKLKDQFGIFEATVGDVEWFGNPVEKVHASATSPINDDNRHYTFYRLDFDEGWMPSSFQVTINNQFQDDVELTVQGPVALAVPTQKEDHAMSDCIDHLLLYTVLHPVEYVPEAIGEVDLYDQFHDELGVTVYEPMFFANPVEKTIVDTGDVTPTTTDDHHVFYPLDDEHPFEKSGLPITNQFGGQVLNIGNPALLAVPSQKIDWEQPLNHFKTYWAEWPVVPPPLWEPPLPVDVQLEDQLVSINATVWAPYLFANPVEKRRIVAEEEEITPIWDPKDHLTLYWIEPSVGPMVWEVTVNNQFGNDQVLYVQGPKWLAVQTGKFTPDWPADVNHFLVYEVVDYEGLYLPTDVYIRDQFFLEGGSTAVYEPGLFAVPAQKTHDGVTPIMDDVHLVFYWIYGIEPWDADNLPVSNQFGEQYLYVEEQEYNFLGVPSEKTAVEGPYI
jgi:hypothetical protein